MKIEELENIINEAFEKKQNISEKSDRKILDSIIRFYVGISWVRKAICMNLCVSV